MAKSSSESPPCPSPIVVHRCIETIHRPQDDRGDASRERRARGAVRDRRSAGRRPDRPSRARARGRRCVHWRTCPDVDPSWTTRCSGEPSWPTCTRAAPGLFEVCDASPYLSRAAKYHGEATDVACPVCRKERLTPGELRVRRPPRSDGRPGQDRGRAGPDGRHAGGVHRLRRRGVPRAAAGTIWTASYVLGAEPAPGQQPAQPAPGGHRVAGTAPGSVAARCTARRVPWRALSRAVPRSDSLKTPPCDQQTAPGTSPSPNR